MAASHAQVGILRSALPKLDLGEAAGDLSRLGRVRRDPDVRRSLADLAEHRVTHRPRRPLRSRAPRRTGRRRGRRRARAARARRRPRPSPRARRRARRAARAQPSASRPRRRPGGTFKRDVGRKLREPADVAHDERLPERERRGSRCPTSRPSSDGGGSRARRCPAMRPQSLGSSTHPSRTSPSSASPSRWRRRSRSKPGEVDPTRSSVSSGCARRTSAVARRSSGIRLLELTTPKQPTTTPLADALGRDARSRPGGMRHDVDRAVEAGCPRPIADVARVDDQAGGVLEDEGRQREVLRSRLPQRRNALVEHAVAEQAPDDAVLALHEVEVRVPVPAPDGHAGNEVVQDEVVEDDDARARAGARPRSTRARRGCSRRGRARRRCRAEASARRGERRSRPGARAAPEGGARCSPRCPSARAAWG